MSGGPAPSSEGLKLHAGHNLSALGSDFVKLSENVGINITNGVYNVWKKTVGGVGNILLKKPVSAALHLVG